MKKSKARQARENTRGSGPPTRDPLLNFARPYRNPYTVPTVGAHRQPLQSNVEPVVWHPSSQQYYGGQSFHSQSQFQSHRYSAPDTFSLGVPVVSGPTASADEVEHLISRIVEGAAQISFFLERLRQVAPGMTVGKAAALPSDESTESLAVTAADLSETDGHDQNTLAIQDASQLIPHLVEEDVTGLSVAETAAQPPNPQRASQNSSPPDLGCSQALSEASIYEELRCSDDEENEENRAVSENQRPSTPPPPISYSFWSQSNYIPQTLDEYVWNG